MLIYKKSCDSDLSWSTYVIVLKIGKYLLSANFRDSRVMNYHMTLNQVLLQKERIYKMGRIVVEWWTLMV